MWKIRSPTLFRSRPLHFLKTTLDGVILIRPEPIHDDRGSFARTYCRDEFERNGLSTDFIQCSTSHNIHQGTLRGIHFQRPPFQEIKLVRCSRGAILDVILDLRATSDTFLQWESFELTAINGDSLWIPPGFGHGFQTLVADTDVYYQIDAPYRSEAAAGVRWDDPAVRIQWPLDVTVISERDQLFPDLDPDAFHSISGILSALTPTTTELPPA